MLDGAPRAVPAYQLRLVQADHRLGEGVVVAVPYGAGRAVYPSSRKRCGVTDRQILATVVGVVNRLSFMDLTLPQRHLQRVQRQISTHVITQPPPDDEPGEAV